MSENIAQKALERGGKRALILGGIIIAVFLFAVFWRVANDPGQGPIVGVSLVIVALIVVPLLLVASARHKAQAAAIAAARPRGTLHFPSPPLTSTRSMVRASSALVGKPVRGKGLLLAPSISVEADGIRGWFGGKDLREAFFYPRENITEIAPFFVTEGIRTFPAIVVGLLRAGTETGDAAPGPDLVVKFRVASVTGDIFAGLSNYERAEAIAREAARVLGVNYLSPDELVRLASGQRAAEET